MTNQQKFYDVYVSYPPGEDPEHVNKFLRESLPEEEANDIINALATQRQAIIAEHCTNEERENAQHYFSYLGLDVIIRLSLELEDNGLDEQGELSDPIPQCPVCYTILENPDVQECPTCSLPFNKLTEQQIQRKRIEWQERVAFEHRKKHEIAYKLLREKQEEEKQLRKQIRAELEQQLMSELGRYSGWRKWFYGKYAFFTIILLGVFLIVLLALVFVISGFLKPKEEQAAPAQTTLAQPAPKPEKAPAPIQKPAAQPPAPVAEKASEEAFVISVPSIVSASETPGKNQ